MSLNPALVEGSVTYADLRFEVAEGVYVPDECMLPTMELAAGACPQHGTVIDLGCGVGAQGIAVARKTRAFVFGIDRNRQAVEMAQRNAEMHGVRGRWYAGNLYEPLGDYPWADVIINTLPYEPSETYEGVEYDGVPADSYIGDGSFGAALYYGTQFGRRMAVYGLPRMELAFAMAGWKVDEYVDTDDGARHFLLSHA